MADKSLTPGEPGEAPIESRRASAAPAVDGTTPAGSGGVMPDQDLADGGEGSVLDVPNMGEFSAEAARPTPLDDIAGAERSELPED